MTMDYKKKIEIPFGAFDSELIRQEISIPKGFKATIEVDKIILTRAGGEDEKVRKALIEMVHDTTGDELWVDYNVHKEDALAWLEKQGEQKPTQEIEPFEAEHGKYYYCIKDYFCGGRKQASKGDIVQALRGLPIMGLKDAGEYFLPVNFIKCNSAWSEEDEKMVDSILTPLATRYPFDIYQPMYNWLKSLKQRIGG